MIYVAVLVGSMAAFTALYWHGMAAFEDRPVSVLHALQVVVETYTTTGYGSDAPWTSAQMNLVVIAMDVLGTVMIFLALPVILFPAFQEALATSVPTEVPEDRSDHVVIVSRTARLDPLLSELDSWDVDHVLVEPDRERARDRYDDEGDVIHAQPDEIEGLEAANLSTAEALVVDFEDRMDASIVLTARELDEDVRVVSVVEEPDRATYHELAGADAVVSPRPLLGERLAGLVTTAITPDLGEAVGLGEDFHVVELPVPRDSELVGKTIAESGLRERAGVNVVGAWFRGEFVTPPPPDAEITTATVLLVTGSDEDVRRLADLSAAAPRPHARGDTIVVGHGEVGKAVTDALDDAGLPYTVLDQRDDPAVDVVGQATDPDALQRAGIEDATSLVLTIPADAETEFATLVARDASDEVNVAARADEARSVRKLYRAGADYVLSLDTVTGRMLASTVLEGEDVLTTDTQVEVVRIGAGELAGKTLGGAEIRTETDCTVVAVERDGELLTDLGPEFRIRETDDLVVAGTGEGVNEFTDRYE
ncbi:NAD-binding protein [Salinarchaeum chitinilyticum]